MMICMANFSENEISFINATIFHVKKNWNGANRLLATEIGVSPAYLSEILHRKKCPRPDKQVKIAKLLGYNKLSDFIDFGEKLTPKDLASVIPAMQMDGVKENINKASLHNIQEPVANICNIQDEAAKRHQVIIEGFEDREWAIAVNEMLVEIEKRGTPEFKALVKGAIENILNILPDTKKGLLNGTKDVK